jgi:hypothetical protein
VIRVSSHLLLLRRIDVGEYGIKCESFSHITPMTEEQTERFFEDHRDLPQNELYEKWQKYAVDANAETDELIRGQRVTRS